MNKASRAVLLKNGAIRQKWAIQRAKTPQSGDAACLGREQALGNVEYWQKWTNVRLWSPESSLKRSRGVTSPAEGRFQMAILGRKMECLLYIVL